MSQPYEPIELCRWNGKPIADMEKGELMDALHEAITLAHRNPVELMKKARVIEHCRPIDNPEIVYDGPSTRKDVA